MDWAKYPSLKTYISRLPKESLLNDTLPRTNQQCILYPEKPNPICEVQKLRFEFAPSTTSEEKVDTKIWINTYSLWSCVTALFDETYSIENRSLQKCHVQYMIQSLKTYITTPVIYSFLTGRRAYPLLELLDKPRVEYDKKHQSALGYFLSFLFDSKVMIEKEVYQWSRDTLTEGINVHLKKNRQGFWSLDKEIKNEEC